MTAPLFRPRAVRDIDEIWTKAGGAEPAAEAAPEAAAQALATLPEWLCELTARLGVDVCAR